MSNTTITCIALTSIEPPHADCELFSDAPRNPKRLSRIHKKVNKLAIPGQSSNEPIEPDSPQSEDLDFENEGGIDPDCNDNFLVLGMSKGHVVFIRLDMNKYIYARFAIHR